jgi:hypothetical protein
VVVGARISYDGTALFGGCSQTDFGSLDLKSFELKS